MPFLLRDVPKFECLQALSERYPDLDPFAVETCLVLLRVSGNVLDAMETLLAGQGISQGRLTVLAVLNRNPEKALQAGDLARRAGVTRATMTGLLDGLERKGLLRRMADSTDRRALIIRLTAKGRRCLDGILPAHYRRIAALMSRLTLSERKNLVRLLAKVEEGVPAFREPAANQHHQGLNHE